MKKSNKIKIIPPYKPQISTEVNRWRRVERLKKAIEQVALRSY